MSMHKSVLNTKFDEGRIREPRHRKDHRVYEEDGVSKHQRVRAWENTVLPEDRFG
jgi:hypothetical protein